MAPAGGLVGAVDSFAAWADAYARKIDAYIEQVNALYEPYRNFPIPLPFPIPPRIPPVAHKAWRLIAGENPQTDEESLHRLGQYWADESRTTFELAERAASAARSVRVEWDGDGAPFAFQAEMQELSQALNGLAHTQAGIALGVSVFRDQTIAARNAFRVQVVMLLMELVAAVVTAIFSFGLSFAGFLARSTGRVAALRAAIGAIISRIWAVRFANGLVELARRGIPLGLQSLRRGLPATLRRFNPLDLTRAVAAREGRQLQRALIGEAITRARQAGRRIGSDELRDVMSREMRDQITRNLDSMLRGVDVDPPTTRLQQLAYEKAKDAVTGGPGRPPLTTARGVVSGVVGYGGRSAAMYGGGGWVLQEGLTIAEVSQYGSQTYATDPAGLASALVGAALGGGPLALGGTAPHMAVHGAIGGALGYAGVQLVEAATTDLTLAEAWDTIVNPHPMRAGGASNFLDAVLQGAVSGGVWERFVGEYGLGEIRGAGRNLVDFIRPPPPAPAGTVTTVDVPIRVETGSPASAVSLEPGSVGTGPPAAIPASTATLPAAVNVGDAGAPAPVSQPSPTSSAPSAPTSTAGGRGNAVAGGGTRTGAVPAGATPDPSAPVDQSGSGSVPAAAEPSNSTTRPVSPAAEVDVAPLDPDPVEVTPPRVEAAELAPSDPGPVEVRDVTSELRDVTSELRDVTSEVRDVTSEVRDVTSELDAPQLADTASRTPPAAPDVPLAPTQAAGDGVPPATPPTVPPAAADVPTSGQVQQPPPDSQLALDPSTPDLRQPLADAGTSPPSSTMVETPPDTAPEAESAPSSQASGTDGREAVSSGDSDPDGAASTGQEAGEPASADATGGGAPPPPVPPAPPGAPDDQPPAFPPTEAAIPDTYRALLSEQDSQKFAKILAEAAEHRGDPGYWKPVPDGWLVQDPTDSEVLVLGVNRSGEVVAHSVADFAQGTTTDPAAARNALQQGLNELRRRSVIDMQPAENPAAMRVRLPNGSTVDVEWTVTPWLHEGESRVDAGRYEPSRSGWRQTAPATIRLSAIVRAGTAEELAADARDQALHALRRLGADLPGPVGDDSVTDSSGRSPHAGALPQGQYWQASDATASARLEAAAPAGTADELLRGTLAGIQSGAPESADWPVTALTGNPDPDQGLKLAHFDDRTTMAFAVGAQAGLDAGELRAIGPTWRHTENGVVQAGPAVLLVSGADTSAAQMDAMVEAGLRVLREMVPGTDHPGLTFDEQKDLQDRRDGSELYAAFHVTGGWPGGVRVDAPPSGLRLETSMATANKQQLVNRLQEWGYRFTVRHDEAAAGLRLSAEPPIDGRHRLRPVEIRLTDAGPSDHPTPASPPAPAGGEQPSREDPQDGPAPARQEGTRALQEYITNRLLRPAREGGVRAHVPRLVAAERLVGREPTSDAGDELWRLTYWGGRSAHVWIQARYQPGPAAASYQVEPGRIVIAGQVGGLDGIVRTRRTLAAALEEYGELVRSGQAWTIPFAEAADTAGHGGVVDEAANRAAAEAAAQQLAAEAGQPGSAGQELRFDGTHQRLTARAFSRKGPVEVVFEFAAGRVADGTTAAAELIDTGDGAPLVRITISDAIPEAQRAIVARRAVANLVAATLAKLQPSLSDRLPGRARRSREDGAHAELRVELAEWAEATQSQRLPYDPRLVEGEQRIGRLLERLGPDRRPEVVERILIELGFDEPSARSAAARLTEESESRQRRSIEARRRAVDDAAAQAVNEVAAALDDSFELTVNAARVRDKVVDALARSGAVGRRLHAQAVVEVARAIASPSDDAGQQPAALAARVLAGHISEQPPSEVREYWQALLGLELGADALVGIADAEPSVREGLRHSLPEALLEDTLSMLRSAGTDARLQDDGRILVNGRTVRIELTDMIRAWLRQLADSGTSLDRVRADLASVLGRALGRYTTPGASDAANALAALERLVSDDLSKEAEAAIVAAAEGVLESTVHTERPLRDDELVPQKLAELMAASNAPPTDPYEALRPQRHRVAVDRLVSDLIELVDAATGPQSDVIGRRRVLAEDTRRVAEVLAEAKDRLLERAEAKATSGEQAREKARVLAGDAATERQRSDRFAGERLRRIEKERVNLAEAADRYGRVRARYEDAATLAEHAGNAYRKLEAALVSGDLLLLVADASAARRAYEAYEQAMGELQPDPLALGAAASRLRVPDLGAVTQEVNRLLAAQGVEIAADELLRRLIPKLPAAVGADGAVIKVGDAEVRLNFLPGGRDGDAEPVEVLGRPESPGKVLIGTRPQAPRGVREIGASANTMRGVAVDPGDRLADLLRLIMSGALDGQAVDGFLQHVTGRVRVGKRWHMSTTGTGSDYALPGAQLYDQGESKPFHVRGDWEVDVRTPEPEASWSEKGRVEDAGIEFWVSDPYTEPAPTPDDTIAHPKPLWREHAEQPGKAWFPPHVALGPTALAGVQNRVLEALGSHGNSPGVRDSVRNLVREWLPSRISDMINHGVEAWVSDGDTPVGRVVIKTKVTRVELVGRPSNQRILDRIRVAFSQITGETTGAVERSRAAEGGWQPLGAGVAGPRVSLGRSVVSLLRKTLRVDAAAIKADLHRYTGYTQAYRLQLEHTVTVWPYDATHNQYGSKAEGKPVEGGGLFLIPETRAYQVGLPVSQEAERGIREDGSHVLRDELRPGPPEGKRAELPTYLGERLPGAGLALVEELTGTRELVARLVEQLRHDKWLPAVDENGNPRFSKDKLEARGQMMNIKAIEILSRDLVEASYDQLAQDGVRTNLIRYRAGRADTEQRTLRLQLRQDWPNATLMGHTDAETQNRLTVASGRFGSKAGESRSGAPRAGMGVDGVPHDPRLGYAKPSTSWSESEAGAIVNRGVLIGNPGMTAVFEMPHQLVVEEVVDTSAGRDGARPLIEPQVQEGTARLLVPASLLPDDGPARPPARNTPSGSGTPPSVLRWARVLHLDGRLWDSVRWVLPDASKPGSAAHLHYSSFTNVLNQAANAEWLLLGQGRDTDLGVDPRGATPKRSSLSMTAKPRRSTFVAAVPMENGDVTLGFPYRETATGHRSAEQLESAGEIGAHRHQADWQVGDSQSLHRRYGRERIGTDAGIQYVYEMPYDATLTGVEQAARLLHKTVTRTAVYAVPEWVALQGYADGELPVPPAQVRDALERYASGELALDPQTVTRVLERYGEDPRELGAAREALQAFVDDPDAWGRLDTSATDELLDRYRQHPDRPPTSRWRAKPGPLEVWRQKAALLETMSESALKGLRLGDDLASRLAGRLTNHVRANFPDPAVPEVTAEQINRLVDDRVPVRQARPPRKAVMLPESMVNAVGHTWIEPTQLHDDAGREVQLLDEVSRLVDTVEPGAVARTPGLRTFLFGQLAGERWGGFLDDMLTPHGKTMPFYVVTGERDLERLTVRLKATASRNGVAVGDLPKSAVATQDYIINGRTTQSESGRSWQDGAGVLDVEAEAGRGYTGSASLDIQDTRLSGLVTDPGVDRVEHGLSISVEVMRDGETARRMMASAAAAHRAVVAARAAVGGTATLVGEAATTPAAAMDAAADAAERIARAATTAAATAVGAADLAASALGTAYSAGVAAAAAAEQAAAAASDAAAKVDEIQAAMADPLANPVAFASLTEAAKASRDAAAAAAAVAKAATDAAKNAAVDDVAKDVADSVANGMAAEAAKAVVAEAADQSATTAAENRTEATATKPRQRRAAASVIAGQAVQHRAKGMPVTDGSPAGAEPSPLADPRTFQLPHDVFVETVETDDTDLYLIRERLAQRELLGAEPTDEQLDKVLTQLAGVPVTAGLEQRQARGQGDPIDLQVPGKPGRYVRVVPTAELSGLEEVGDPMPAEIRHEYRDQQVVGEALARDRTLPATGKVLVYEHGESAGELVDLHHGNRTEVKVYMTGEAVPINARVDYRLRFLVVEEGTDGQRRPVPSGRDWRPRPDPPPITVTARASIIVFNSETGIGAIRNQLETPAHGATWLLGRTIPAAVSLDALLATASGKDNLRYRDVSELVEKRFGSPGRRTIHLRASAAGSDALDPLDVVRLLAKDRPGDQLYITVAEPDGMERTFHAKPNGELVPRLPDGGYAAARASLAPADVARANRAGVDLPALFKASREDPRTFAEVVREAVESAQPGDNSRTATVLKEAPADGGEPDQAGTNQAIDRAATALRDRIGDVSTDRAGRVLVAPEGADYVLRFEAGDPERDRPPATERRLRSRREPASERTADGKEIIRVIVTDSLPVDELTSGMTTRDVWVRRIVVHEVAEEAAVRRRATAPASQHGQPDALARGADPGRTTLSAHDEAHLAEVVYLADLLRTLQVEDPSFSPAVADVEQQLWSLLDELGLVDDLHDDVRMRLLERHLPDGNGSTARLVEQLRRRPDPALEVALRAALDAAEAVSPDLTSEDQLSDPERGLRDKSIDPTAPPVSLGGNTFLVRLTDGTLGIYKPILPQSVRRLSIPANGLANREVAAYRLDEEFGFGLVPPTTFWHGPFGWGSLQQFVESTTDGDPDLQAYSRLERERMAVLDYVAGNLDRNPGNLRTGPDGELIAVDHGFTFPVAGADPIRSRVVLEELNRGLSDEVLEQVRAIDPDRLAGQLRAAGLSQHAIDGTLARLREVQTAGAIIGEAWEGGYLDPSQSQVDAGTTVPSDQWTPDRAPEPDLPAALRERYDALESSRARVEFIRMYEEMGRREDAAEPALENMAQAAHAKGMTLDEALADRHEARQAKRAAGQAVRPVSPEVRNAIDEELAYLEDVKARVESFARRNPVPGIDEWRDKLAAEEDALREKRIGQGLMSEAGARQHGNRVRGVDGEVRLAEESTGVIAVSLKVSAIGPNGKRYPSEMDVVTDEGRVWKDAKNHNYFGLGSDRYRGMVERIKNQLLVIAYGSHYYVDGEPPQLEVHFTQGVDAQVAAELEKVAAVDPVSGAKLPYRARITGDRLEGPPAGGGSD